MVRTFRSGAHDVTVTAHSRGGISWGSWKETVVQRGRWPEEVFPEPLGPQPTLHRVHFSVVDMPTLERETLAFLTDLESLPENAIRDLYRHATAQKIVRISKGDPEMAAMFHDALEDVGNVELSERIRPYRKDPAPTFLQKQYRDSFFEAAIWLTALIAAGALHAIGIASPVLIIALTVALMVFSITLFKERSIAVALAKALFVGGWAGAAALLVFGLILLVTFLIVMSVG